jgi:hypothetical protein
LRDRLSQIESVGEGVDLLTGAIAQLWSNADAVDDQ